MPEYIVDLWLDGYDTESEMEKACDEFIYEQLNFTASSVRVKRSDYADLLTRHNALVEAVAWERECCQDIRPLVAWAGLYVLHGEDYVDAVAEALREIQGAARAEVDRLIADCKGEE